MVHYNFQRYQLDMLYQILGNPEAPRYEINLAPMSVLKRHIFLIDPDINILPDLTGLKDFLNILIRATNELSAQIKPQPTEQTPRSGA